MSLGDYQEISDDPQTVCKENANDMHDLLMRHEGRPNIWPNL